MFQYILYTNTGIREYIEGKRKSKADFRVNIFKTINTANTEGIEGANGGNNPRYNNSTQNINNITVNNNTREGIKAI